MDIICPLFSVLPHLLPVWRPFQILPVLNADIDVYLVGFIAVSSDKTNDEIKAAEDNFQFPLVLLVGFLDKQTEGKCHLENHAKLMDLTISLTSSLILCDFLSDKSPYEAHNTGEVGRKLT